MPSGVDSPVETSDSELTAWMKAIREIYEKKKRLVDFEKEQEALAIYIVHLRKEFEGRYKLEAVLSVGGSGVVFTVARLGFSQKLILKFNRPSFSDESNMVEKEIRFLEGLDHPRIVRMIDAGAHDFKKSTIPVLHYLLEPAVFGPHGRPENLGKFVELSITALREKFGAEMEAGDPKGHALAGVRQLLTTITGLCHEWTDVLGYLHNKDIIYIDLKPDNVLVDHAGHLVAIDFGTAERLDVNDSSPVVVFYTRGYEHPVLHDRKKGEPSYNRIRGSMPRKDLRKEFDFYAFGQSIIELLNTVAAFRPNDVPQLPEFRALHFLSTRLLDGKNRAVVPRQEPIHAREVFEGLSPEDYDAIAYHDVSATGRDLRKELKTWDLESHVPELDSHGKDVVRAVPAMNTVMSLRLRRVLEHPTFARLKMVSQLGLISLVYPTADHSRYDHALGSYTYAGNYIKSLFNDSHNPIFRSVVGEDDIKTVLLASLLHDLGQFPLAHDLEEVHPGVFDHKTLAIELLDEGTTDGEGRSLESIITDPVDGWGVDFTWLKRVMGDEPRGRDAKLESYNPLDANFKVTLLMSLIDGPIDSDKADYIIRDSNRCELPYGAQLDIERLLRVLTVAVVPQPKSRRHRIALGVYDKGLPSAHAFSSARYLLLSSVYWHHTSRAIKAMLQYATAMALPEEVFRVGEREQTERLRAELREFVKSLRPPFENVPQPSGRSKITVESGMDTPPAGRVANADFLRAGKKRKATQSGAAPEESPTPQAWYPGIAYTDWLMLDWIRRLNPESRGRHMLDLLCHRELYKRVATIDRSTANRDITGWLTNRSWGAKGALCEKVQEGVLEMLLTHYGRDTTPSMKQDKLEALFREQLVILIDAPDPEKKTGFNEPLVTVPELKSKRYYQEGYEPRVDEAWTANVRAMVEAAAPIRVLCHPAVRKDIASAIRGPEETFAKLVRYAIGEIGH